MVLSRWTDVSDSGNSPEKLLSLRKRDLRLTKPERLGTEAERELPLKLRTLSWSNWFMLFSSSEPVRFIFSRTSFETLVPLMHSLTPSQLQRSVPRHGIEFDGSMDDFKLSRVSTSLDLTGETM
ncbi:hypothetical protein Bca52824_086855 [Brassica carinata]|uniref:Uncharacterized protein n=1 Tax=Brassica carinata TaxID=52824 RepID=A0A8X7PAU7_BRACI|nr:hypothetical protein Bca52824_086855 [Brassica carinata]